MQPAPLYEIDPKGDLPLARAYRDRPEGPHRPDLLRLLNRLRWEPANDRHVLVCLERHRRWALGKMDGRRGAPVRLLEDQTFTSRREAEWAVFKLRWKRATGHDLPFP